MDKPAVDSSVEISSTYTAPEQSPDPELDEYRRQRQQKRWDKENLSDEELLAKYGKTHDGITEDDIFNQTENIMDPCYRNDWFPGWQKWETLCEHRRKNWLEWTDVDAGLKKFKDLLRSDFGPEIWVSRPRKTPTVMIDDYGYWNPDSNTQAWITLPHRATPNGDADTVTHEMTLDEALRFRRTMKVLKLSKGFKLTKRRWLEKGKKPKNKPVWPSAKGEWPRLVNLITPSSKDHEADGNGFKKHRTLTNRFNLAWWT